MTDRQPTTPPKQPAIVQPLDERPAITTQHQPAESAACCSPPAQASCCAPAAKSACCGTDNTRCGCQ